MNRATRVLALVIATLCCIGCAERDRTEWKQSPKADFDRLLALASSEENKEGFEAILELRDIADERAVPVLSAVLEKHVGTNLIHGFAAAQALFCIGTEEAHEVLRKHLFSDVYSARLGILYALAGWNMKDSKRDPFIAQYHLQSTSNDIGIDVASNSKREGGRQKIEFKVTLRNDSNRPLRVFVPAVYLAEMLILQSPEGHFVQGGAYVDVEKPFPSFSELLPGKCIDFHMAGVVRKVNMVAAERPFSMVFKHVLHDVKIGGRYRVYAMYGYEKAYAKHYLRHGKYSKLPENIWYGRAVSEPIEVEIGPAAESGGQ